MTSRRSGRKSSGKPSVPQPHGGVLVPGAGGGRQPGSGRPPSRIRHALRQSFEDRIRLLEEIADGAGGKTTVGRMSDAPEDVPRSQAYYWTPEWQEAEAEADADIKAGRVKSFDSVDEAIAYLLGEEE